MTTLLTTEEKELIINLYHNGPRYTSVRFHEKDHVYATDAYISVNDYGERYVRVPLPLFNKFITLHFDGETGYVACLKEKYFNMATDWERAKIREAEELSS